ncbi:MAG: hypothetical protein JWO33_740 [Caulobacteraceae bacterium]|nr:hypothetical protein [Caulobacteraceae bacterium]
MADIINLNRARKAKARSDRTATVAANRAAHGRTQAQKALERARADKAARELDGLKRER